MRTRVKRVVVGAMAGLALTFALPANPAFAINAVNCGNRTDFLKIVSWAGTIGMQRCYANRGVVAVNIGDVSEYHSGNNKVTVNYEFGGRYYSDTLEKWRGIRYPSGIRVRVYEVRIW